MENTEKVNEKVEETEDEKLPHCQITTTAEHARWDDDDGPCDDGRGSGGE